MNCIPFGILFDLVNFTFTINLNYIVATFTYKLLCMTDSEVYVTQYLVQREVTRLIIAINKNFNPQQNVIEYCDVISTAVQVFGGSFLNPCD